MNTNLFFETDEGKRRNQVLAQEKSTLWGNDQVPKFQMPRKHQGWKKRTADGGEKKFGFAVQCKKPRYHAGFVSAELQVHAMRGAGQYQRLARVLTAGRSKHF